MAATKTTKPSTPKKPQGPVVVPDAPDPDEEVAVPDGAEAAFAQYFPLAQKAMTGATPATYSQDPNRAYHNVLTGIAALEPHKAVLQALPAPFDYQAMCALPAVALATVYAAATVNHSSPGTIRALQKSASALREIMLSSAITLMKSGDLRAADVNRIIKGKGPIDQAQDCVDLAALFTVNAQAVAGKTPITQAQIDKARTVGNQLLQILKPANTPRKPLAETNAGVAARDLMGAYLVAQHKEHMRRAAHWIWGDDLEEHVPALHSHERAPKKKEKPAGEGASGATGAGATGATGATGASGPMGPSEKGNG